MKHDYQSCAAVALTYQTKKDFRSKSSGEFQWLRRNNLLDTACAHMDTLRRSLSDADVAEIAARYTHRRAFKLGDQSAYNAAKKRGIIDSVCSHMATKWRSQSDVELAEVASKFPTRSEFSSGDSGAYQTAVRRGILEAICSHMPPGDRSLSDAEIIAIASKYKTRMRFKERDFGAYTTMLRRGLELDACRHMEPGFTSFRDDLPAVLYQYRMTTPDGQVLHKVGITNRPPSKRLLSMGLVKGVSASLVSTIHFQSGRDARIREKQLHKQFSCHRYTGCPVMKNGNTELFTVPVI